MHSERDEEEEEEAYTSGDGGNDPPSSMYEIEADEAEREGELRLDHVWREERAIQPISVEHAPRYRNTWLFAKPITN